MLGEDIAFGDAGREALPGTGRTRAVTWRRDRRRQPIFVGKRFKESRGGRIFPVWIWEDHKVEASQN